eukprot:gene25516-45319_t
MAAVIGHEITHGFDDSGRKYDKDGNLVDGGWWAPESVTKFKTRADCIKDQYGAFEVPNNIADNGGLKAALNAYRDLTAEQTFFLSFGQKWCVHARAQSLQRSLKTDPHSPPQFRVLGTLQNNPDFAAAYGCKAGDTYVPTQRCALW